MKPELEKKIKELRKLEEKIDEISKPLMSVYDEVNRLSKERDEVYRKIAGELGIEYCKHDQSTINNLIEYLKKQ